jgi:hypothetical protein
MTKPNDPVSGQFHGLTKREYFAIIAVQGILAHVYGRTIDAASVADALIKELNKTSNDQGN